MTATLPEYSGTCDHWLEFGDGLYHFDLPFSEMAELQEKCGRGFLAIYGTLMRGRYHGADDVTGFAIDGEAPVEVVRETIRLALIGGGRAIVDGREVEITAARAKQLCDLYVTPACPFVESWTLAAVIMDAKVHGREPVNYSAAELPERHPANVVREILRQAAERPPVRLVEETSMMQAAARRARPVQEVRGRGN